MAEFDSHFKGLDHCIKYTLYTFYRVGGQNTKHSLRNLDWLEHITHHMIDSTTTPENG